MQFLQLKSLQLQIQVHLLEYLQVQNCSFVIDLHTYNYYYAAQITPCCCNEEVEKYRDFNITWNITMKGETVVVDCKGDGLIGTLELSNSLV